MKRLNGIVRLWGRCAFAAAALVWVAGCSGERDVSREEVAVAASGSADASAKSADGTPGATPDDGASSEGSAHTVSEASAEGSLEAILDDELAGDEDAPRVLEIVTAILASPALGGPIAEGRAGEIAAQVAKLILEIKHGRTVVDEIEGLVAGIVGTGLPAEMSQGIVKLVEAFARGRPLRSSPVAFLEAIAQVALGAVKLGDDGSPKSSEAVAVLTDLVDFFSEISDGGWTSAEAQEVINRLLERLGAKSGASRVLAIVPFVLLLLEKGPHSGSGATP